MKCDVKQVQRSDRLNMRFFADSITLFLLARHIVNDTKHAINNSGRKRTISRVFTKMLNVRRMTRARVGMYGFATNLSARLLFFQSAYLSDNYQFFARHDR